MPISLIKGPIHPCLEQALLDDISAAKREDSLQPIVVIVGARMTVDYLTWRLAESAINGFNVTLLTLAQLERELSLLSFRRRPESRYLPQHGKWAATVTALHELAEGQYFYAVASQPRFRKTLARAFDDLDEACIAGIERVTGTELQRSKWSSLARLRAAYLKSLIIRRTVIPAKAGIQSERDRSVASAEGFDPLIQDPRYYGELIANFANCYGCANPRLYGIYDFTEEQRRLVEALSKGVELTVYLPYWSANDEWGTSYAYAEPTHRWMMSLDAAAGRSAAFVHERTKSIALFRYKPDPANSRIVIPAKAGIQSERDRSVASTMGTDAGAVVKIFAGWGVADEIDGVIGRINELALHEGVPLSSIGIMLWQQEKYLNGLNSGLKRAGIPFFNALGTPLQETSAGRTLQRLLTLAYPAMNRRELVDLWADYELRPVKALGNADTALWEFVTLGLGMLEGTADHWTDALHRFEKSIDDGYVNIDGIDSLRVKAEIALLCKFIEDLARMLEPFHAASSFDAAIEAILEMAGEYLPAGEETDSVLNALAPLAELGAAFPALQPSDAANAAAEALQTTRNRSGRYIQDGVTIIDRMTARGVRFDVLFIPGLAQGLAPIAAREDVILSDAERRLINQSLANDSPFPPLSMKARRVEEERLLFALAADSARLLLYLSYPLRDELSRSRRLPSRYLTEMCRAMTGKIVSSDQLHKSPLFEDIAQEDENPRRRFAIRQQAVDGLIRGHKLSAPAVRALFAGRFPAWTRAMRANLARKNLDAFTAWDGIIGDAAAGLVPDTHTVSSLQNYAACPFRYMILDRMNAGEWDEPEIEFAVSQAVLGSIVHRALSNFFVSAKHDQRLPLTAKHRDWAESRIRELLRRNLRRERARRAAPEAAWQAAARSLETMLLGFIADEISADSGYTFDCAEEKLTGTLKLSSGEGPFEVNLDGRIDRIDRAQDGAVRIVDYKTGSRAQKPSDFDGGKNIQLPLYLLLAQRVIKDVNLFGSVAEIVQIGDGGKRQGFALQGVEVEARAEELGRLVKHCCDGIARGDFHPQREESQCRICEVKRACDELSRAKWMRDATKNEG